MGDPLSPQEHMPLPRSNNLPMLYYGLVIVGTAAIVIILYNFTILRWCSDVTNQRRSSQRTSRFPGPTASRSSHTICVHSFKYTRDGEDEDNEYECAVCLSVFEEGEQLRQLPNCRHSFHANCIDMWLYSHLECPLCRASVETPRNVDIEHSYEGLMIT